MTGYNVVVGRNTDNAPKCALSSQTVAFSHYNNFSAQLPIDPKTGKMVEGGIREQADQCFANIKAVVESIDHVMEDVVRISIYVKDIMDMAVVDEVQKAYFPTYAPARTVAAVAALPMDAMIQVEALLTNGEGTIPNAPQAGDLLKLTNNTCDAPMDHMSTQTVAFSHYNNITAQLPIEPKTGRILATDVQGQAEQCLKNIKAILNSIDVPMDDIVKINIFLKDLADLEAVDEVYKKFLPDSGIARAVAYVPARTVIQVADLPLHALVQVEAVVSHGDGTPPQAIEDRHGLIIEANNTDAAPKCAMSTQTVAFSHYNNISGQLGMTADGKMAEGAKAQAAQCLANIKAIAECVDHSLDDVVKINIFVKDMADMEAIDEAYAEFFPTGIPARKVVGVDQLPAGALVQIDAILGNEEGTPPIA